MIEKNKIYKLNQGGIHICLGKNNINYKILSVAKQIEKYNEIMSTEKRFCQCGCKKSKIVRKNLIWRFFKGHSSHLRKGKTIEEIYGKRKAKTTHIKNSIAQKGKPSHMKGKHHSNIAKQRNREKHLGTKRIYNIKLKKEKVVSKKLLKQYLKDGWILGLSKQHINRLSKSMRKRLKNGKYFCLGTKHIHKGKQRKMVKKDILNSYLKNGWELGYNIKSWNKGLTKYNDERIMSSSIKQKANCRNTKYLSNMLSKVCKCPNGLEIKVATYLNILYPNKFKYVGDGKFVRAGRSVDFYSKKLNTVVLANGDYFHCNPKTYFADFYHSIRKMTAQEIWEYDKDTINRFKNLGFKVVTLWEKNINNIYWINKEYDKKRFTK